MNNEIDAFYKTLENAVDILPVIINQRGWLIALPFLVALLVAVRLRRPMDFLVTLGALTSLAVLIFAVIFAESLIVSL
jgi:hypothetical protein